MSKQLFLRNAVASAHRGNNDAKLNAATSWWAPLALAEARGGSGFVAFSANSVAGPSNGVEFVNAGSIPLEWLSEPLSADFTISGTITLNLWGLEGSMNNNCGINAVIDKVDGATGTLTRIATSAFATELGTSATANNFTVTPTSTACKRGDRLRVRVFLKDAGGTMAAGSNTFYVDGTSAAQGDSWVQFTENLTFEPAGDPQAFLEAPASTGNITMGQFAASVGRAQQFAASSSVLTSVQAQLSKSGTPTDNVVIEIQSDAGGLPSGTSVGTVTTITGGSLTTTATLLTWSGLSITLVPGSLYWLVFRRTGAADASNFYIVQGNAAANWSTFLYAQWNSTTWSIPQSNICIYAKLGFVPSTYYLTDTAETINPGSATEKKALTTRGSGFVTATTQAMPTAGPISPVQATASSGGAALEWYTPPLNAVTLGGKTKFSMWAYEGSPAGNISAKAEIAIVATDGTGPVVWGVADLEASTANGSVGELPGGTGALVYAWVSGANTSITTGQRLRFRIYFDDCGDVPVAALSGGVFLTYNGTTAAASGDTFVILPVSVTEAVAAIPSFVFETRRVARNSLLRR